MVNVYTVQDSDEDVIIATTLSVAALQRAINTSKLTIGEPWQEEDVLESIQKRFPEDVFVCHAYLFQNCKRYENGNVWLDANNIQDGIHKESTQAKIEQVMDNRKKVNEMWEDFSASVKKREAISIEKVDKTPKDIILEKIEPKEITLERIEKVGDIPITEKSNVDENVMFKAFKEFLKGWDGGSK